jgi:putative acetyltransferase
MVLIREENPNDYDAVRELNRTAFEGESEAQLVDDLPNEVAVVVALVAVESSNIVRHILFSAHRHRNRARCPSCCVAGTDGCDSAMPASGHRFSFGAAWARLCRERGYSMVIVVGHPDYYPRFGLAAKLTRNLVTRIRALVRLGWLWNWPWLPQILAC